MPVFKKKKKSGWFAMRASEKGTCVAHVINNSEDSSYDQKPFVILSGIRPENLNDEKSVRSLVTEFELNRYHCSLLLSKGEYQLLQIEKPNVPKNELSQAVSWKLKNMIDYPVELATIDVVNIPLDPNNTIRQPYIYAVVTKNETLIPYIKRFIDHSKSGLEAIDIPELAQRNIAAYLEQEGRGMAMLSINSNGGLLTFTSGGNLYHARNIDVETKSIQSQDGMLKTNVFERLTLEIQRSLDHFERQFPYIPINRLVLAPFMGREDFYDYLKSYLYIQIDRFDLNDVFVFEKNLDLGDLSSQASLLPVLGAALRGSKA